MTPDAVAAAANTLADLRRARLLVAALADGQRPTTLAEGYAVQGAMITAYGAPVAGWKIGATAKPIMERFGVSEPFTGPVFAPNVARAPARIAAVDHPHLCVEAEFAFRLAKPIVPRDAPYGRDEVCEAIGAVLPAFEVVSPRFLSLMFDQVASVIADGGLNGAMVLGPETADWRALDLPDHAVTVSIDGVERARGAGRNVMGDPVAVLAWTANHYRGRGLTLNAGQFISTGATTGLHFLEPEQTIRADFGPLGTISLTFTGPRSDVAVVRP